MTMGTMNARRKVMRESYLVPSPSPRALAASLPVLNSSYPMAVMSSPESVARISELLHEAAETHHVVYRITDGDDPDWASWYADWLLDLSELPEALGRRPVRSHLVHALVELDRLYTAASPKEPWEDWYAERLPSHFRRYAEPTPPP
jgi:hypothetical protein